MKCVPSSLKSLGLLHLGLKLILPPPQHFIVKILKHTEEMF